MLLIAEVESMLTALHTHHIKFLFEVVHTHEHYITLFILAIIFKVAHTLIKLFLRHLRHFSEVDMGCSHLLSKCLRRKLISRFKQQLGHLQLNMRHERSHILLSHGTFVYFVYFC